MIIHIGATDESGVLSPIQQLVQKRDGKELHVGKRLIGWNLKDTIALRCQGIPQAQLQRYIRHFAAQRHVVFESPFPAAPIDPYIELARELRDYLFAFVEAPVQKSASAQALIKAQFLTASCKVVTLRPARSLPQIEVLLLAAPIVLRSYDPLVLPEPARRKLPIVRKTETAA
jgi:hypothetical protein